MFKLAEIDPRGLQKHYRAESAHLLESWPMYTSDQPEIVAWAMAKDFAEHFQRHSYSEWAYVFGIRKNHTQIALGLRPERVYETRRLYQSNQDSDVVYWVFVGLCFAVLTWAWFSVK